MAFQHQEATSLIVKLNSGKPYLKSLRFDIGIFVGLLGIVFSVNPQTIFKRTQAAALFAQHLAQTAWAKQNDDDNQDDY